MFIQLKQSSFISSDNPHLNFKLGSITYTVSRIEVSLLVKSVTARLKKIYNDQAYNMRTSLKTPQPSQHDGNEGFKGGPQFDPIMLRVASLKASVHDGT